MRRDVTVGGGIIKVRWGWIGLEICTRRSYHQGSDIPGGTWRTSYLQITYKLGGALRGLFDEGIALAPLTINHLLLINRESPFPIPPPLPLPHY